MFRFVMPHIGFAGKGQECLMPQSKKHLRCPRCGECNIALLHSDRNPERKEHVYRCLLDGTTFTMQELRKPVETVISDQTY